MQGNDVASSQQDVMSISTSFRIYVPAGIDMMSETKGRFHVEVSTRISIRNTQILHCALR